MQFSSVLANEKKIQGLQIFERPVTRMNPAPEVVTKITSNTSFESCEDDPCIYCSYPRNPPHLLGSDRSYFSYFRWLQDRVYAQFPVLMTHQSRLARWRNLLSTHTIGKFEPHRVVKGLRVRNWRGTTHRSLTYQPVYVAFVLVL
jgi:hypothetical protein